MARPYKPLAFANEFIAKSGPVGSEHMKLQKLTYLAYGWWLAYNDDLILSEEPQVWTHGPVFKSLYFALSTHGRKPIANSQKDGPFGNTPRVDDGDTEVHNLLAWIWDRYGENSSYYLSDLTHKVGTPWQQIAEKFDYKVPKNTAIPKDIIQEHYKNLIDVYGFGAAPK